MNSQIKKALATVLLILASQFATGQFSGGNGAWYDPYQITTPEQLDLVRNYLNNTLISFILMNDLDLTDECGAGGIFYNSGQGWIPIGSSSASAFRGEFNGNGRKITGLFINRAANNQGLFGYLEGAWIRELELENISITGAIGCGGITGIQASGLIIGCQVSGNIFGTWRIGGVAGEQQSNIKSCQTSGTVSGSQYVGGMSGYMASGEASITNSSSECTVNGLSGTGIGGFSGYSNGALTNCYASGNVSGGSEVGGFIGLTQVNTTVNACYSLGLVQASDEHVGGFAGKLSPRTNVNHCYSLSNVIRTNGTNATFAAFCGLNEDAAIKHCYATGSVTTSGGSYLEGKGFTGDIITGDYIVMTGNYFDMNTSGLYIGLGATGKTTQQMMVPSTFEDWDFEHVWDIDYYESYPFLRHENIYPAPRNLSAASDSSCVHLTWNSPNGEIYIGYRIFRDGVRIGPEIRIESWFNDSTAANGMSYSYYVVALYDQELSIPSNSVTVTRFSGGTGSAFNPYQIAIPAQLNCMRNYLNDNSASFILLNDIDLTASCAPGGEFYNFGQGWIPVGSSSLNAFSGKFYGNGKKITGLQINRIANNQGLFGYLQSAIIQDLELENVNITGTIGCGGITGIQASGLIINCQVSGSISGTWRIGGIVGEQQSNIKNCHSSGTVSGSQYIGGISGDMSSNGASATNSSSGSIVTGFSGTYIGGFAGYGNGSLTNCHASGNVSGGSEVGGLIGTTHVSATVNACYSLGSVQANGDNAGGLIGKIKGKSYINNCYARGNVIRSNGNDTSFGAFCGQNENSIINHSYATGSVKTSAGVNIEGKGFAGSFITGDYISMKGNYFDMNTSGLSYGTGAEGRTTAEMYLEDTYGGWDFNHVWNINENYCYPELMQEGIYSPPRNLTASANDYRVLLDWIAPIGEEPTGYRVFRDNQLLTFNMLSQSAYVDSSVFHGMNYTYHVIAYFNSTPSIPSNSVNVTLFAEGTGYIGDPYLITNHHQLNCVRNYLNQNDVYFKLMNDIDLTTECLPGGDYYYFGQGWIPIGNNTDKFMGQFDGNGKKISGLNINRNTHYQGLFGYAESSQIINLGLENVSIAGGHNCGGLIGYLSTGSLINYCYVHGTVQGAFYTGGLAGYSRSTLRNCHTSGSVTGSLYTGGLVGYFSNVSAIISGCHSNATVYGGSTSGGLIGYCRGSVLKSFATGSVTGTSETGGLIGNATTGSSVETSYALGNISLSGSNGGGLIGKIYYDTRIANCYSRGNLTRTGGVNAAMGGFCGLNDNSKILNCFSTGSVKTSDGVNIEGKGFTGNFVTGSYMVMTDNYFDMNTSGQISGNGATGKTTDAMTYPYGDGAYAGWDFPDTWRNDHACLYNNGYPFLFWQQPNGLQLPLVTTTEITSITATSAIGAGNVIFDGNSTIISRGFCWSTLPNPTILNSLTDEGPGVEEFTSSISGLVPSMTYYIRAYATNTTGTGYGNQLTFLTDPPADPTINIVRCGPSNTAPEALPVQITGSNANPFTTNLTQWTGTYQAPQSLYDQGIYKNDPDRWSNIGGSSTTGSKWYNTSAGISYGILVVDLKQIRAIQDISVFQMFGDGKTTHIALALHPETGSTSPPANDSAWNIFLPKSAVESGTNYSSYISSPTTFTVNATTRYIKIMVYNDGSKGNPNFISLKGIKIFSGPYLPNITISNVTLNNSTSEHCFGATQTITVNDFIVEDGGSAQLAAGLNIFLQNGTKIETGGYLHAHINPDGNYCQPSPMISNEMHQNNEISASLKIKKDCLDKLLIVPNPNPGNFRIVIHESCQNYSGTLQIFNVTGEMIKELHITNQNIVEIDIAGHSPGIYFLLHRRNDVYSVCKIIVQK